MSSAPVPGAAVTRTEAGNNRRRSTSTSAPRAGSSGSPTHRHLERRADEPPDRFEQERERGGVLTRHRRQRRDPALGACGRVGVAGERGQPQQPVGGEGVLGRGGVVLGVLGPDDQRFGVGAGREEPAALVVGEQRDQPVGDGTRLGQPADVVELGQREQRLEQRGVVLGVREQVGAPVLPRPQQAAVVAPQLAEEEPRVRARRVHPVVAPERVRPPRPASAGTSAFHPSSTLSSSPGRTRCSRAANSVGSTAADRVGAVLGRGPTAWRMLPRKPVCGSSKLPRAVTPK